MDCGHCGAASRPGQRFCGHCGRPLAAACRSCGADNPPDHRFCGRCGTELSPAPAPPETPTVTERRVVSVLFVDLVGFTSFSEGRDPEDVRNLITEYFDLARDVVDRFGGTVDKFIGDAVMAWWGAVASREDDAERAARAALEVVDGVSALGVRRGIPDLAARAGVMTGEVAVGPGGNEKGLLLGDLVNSASRLQSLAEPGSVLVGERTASLVGDAIDVRDAGTHRVKGRTEPVVAFEAVRVLGERGGRGRADSLEPPFTGRTSELRLLKETLHATGRDRRARLVSLVGQAGIGKSRLVWEFQKYVDGLIEDVYWHEGRSPSYGDGLALWALGEMVRRRAGISETDPEEVTATKLAAAADVFVADDRSVWVTERLSALLGVGGGDGGERSELFAAVRTFFEGIASRGTVVLVFEDLHWADPSLLEFIEELGDWSQDHPIMVVTLARPDLLDRRPDWGSGRRGFTSVYLASLADDEMAETVAGTVSGIPDAAVTQIVEVAGGVPLFAVEMLRMLLAEGRLVAGDDGVEIAGNLEKMEVPTSVQAVVSARIDRLGADERELIRDASVLGFSFPADALAALRNESVDELERRLAALVRHEIFELDRDPRSPERGHYRWVQGLVREVAYARISRADRRDLHLRVARYFRELEDPELAPVAAAHLIDAARETDGSDTALETEMVEAVRRAIERFRSLHAYEQILSLTEIALPVVPSDVEVELRELAASAAVSIVDLEAADRHVAALRDLAASEPQWIHRAVALEGWVANETRRSGEAVDLMASHLEHHPDLSSDLHLARIGVSLARAYMLGGRDVEAAALADRALGAVEELGLIDEVADAMVTRGTSLARTRYHQGMALLRGARELCRREGLVATELRALINIGYASQDPRESLAAYRAAFEEAKRVGDRSHAVFVASNQVLAHLWRLELEAAEELLEDPVWADSDADRIHRLIERAAVALLRGDRTAADALMAEAGQLTDAVADPQVHMQVEREQTRFWLFDGDYEAVFGTGRRHWGPFAPGLAVIFALTGAGMMGSPEAIGEAAAMAEELSPGEFNGYLVAWARALAAAVDGDVDGAVAVTDGLVAALTDVGMLYVLVVAVLSVARMLSPGHEARVRYRDLIADVSAETGAAGFGEFAGRALEDTPT